LRLGAGRLTLPLSAATSGGVINADPTRTVAAMTSGAHRRHTCRLSIAFLCSPVLVEKILAEKI
jgi:hypothetical protein